MPRTIARMRTLGPVMERRLRAMGAVEGYRRPRFVFGRAVSAVAARAMEAALLDCDGRRLPPEVRARLAHEGRT
ncbi:hypothetical protein [Salinarimonas soli]|uniref:Uncharacterized protein n=1 Tax=Salinarimonas soli TaxID=1638099 RepID=A0A5B2VAI3_9HYPH|nr:hypothetical protein [Salinarimonas soli]KAA2236021.1 hypothetical protein F0L46_16740 [Salinarimonas soli]